LALCNPRSCVDLCFCLWIDENDEDQDDVIVEDRR